jgi:hypothetical protein
MLGWLLLFIIAGGLFYKYRRTDINQNGEEPSSPSSSSVVSIVAIVVAILIVLTIIMAAILYAWIGSGPGTYSKGPPHGQLMAYSSETDVLKVVIYRMSPSVSLNSVHWYLIDIQGLTKDEGMVTDIYGFKQGEGRSITFEDIDLNGKVSVGDNFVFYPGEGQSNSSYSLADVTSLNDYSFRLKYDVTGDVIEDVSLRPE